MKIIKHKGTKTRRNSWDLCLLILYDRHDLTIWGRMLSDAQFAGSSSVPAHVEMMGLIGMGNNPMVGASVAVAVAVSQA